MRREASATSFTQALEINLLMNALHMSAHREVASAVCDNYILRSCCKLQGFLKKLKTATMFAISERSY